MSNSCKNCERLRALLETANAYGAGENAARIAAEEERDRLRAAIPIVEDGCVLVCIEDGELDRLRAEVAALKKDAERYRWMRSNPLRFVDGRYVMWHADEIDKNIDAALEEQKK